MTTKNGKLCGRLKFNALLLSTWTMAYSTTASPSRPIFKQWQHIHVPIDIRFLWAMPTSRETKARIVLRAWWRWATRSKRRIPWCDTTASISHIPSTTTIPCARRHITSCINIRITIQQHAITRSSMAIRSVCQGKKMMISGVVWRDAHFKWYLYLIAAGTSINYASTLLCVATPRSLLHMSSDHRGSFLIGLAMAMDRWCNDENFESIHSATLILCQHAFTYNPVSYHTMTYLDTTTSSRVSFMYQETSSEDKCKILYEYAESLYWCYIFQRRLLIMHVTTRLHNETASRIKSMQDVETSSVTLPPMQSSSKLQDVGDPTSSRETAWRT